MKYQLAAGALAAIACASTLAYFLTHETYHPYPSDCPDEHRISSPMQPTSCPKEALYDGVTGLAMLFKALDGAEVCDARIENARLRLAVVGTFSIDQNKAGNFVRLFIEMSDVSDLTATRDLKDGTEEDVPSPLDLILEDGAFLIGSLVEDDDRLTLLVDQANMTRSNLGGSISFHASSGCAIDHLDAPLSPATAVRILAQRERELDL